MNNISKNVFNNTILLIHLGLDFEDVAERLGDTVEMIQSTYYHMFPEKKSNTVNALNKLHENSLQIVCKTILVK